MSRRTKIWLITAMVLTVAGLIFCTATLAVWHWDVERLGTEKYETKSYEIAGNIDGISIGTDTADIFLVASEEDKCKVVCREPEKWGFLVEMKEGTLTISPKDERRWYDCIEISVETPEIIIYMPEGEYEELLVRESTGDVEIPDDFSFEIIDILTSTGDVKNYASASEAIRIKTSTGYVHVEDVVCSGDLEINVNTGRVRVNDVVCKNLVSMGSTGELFLENVIAGEKITVERSTGDVKFEDCDGGEISVDTHTGDVIGTLLSEKIFAVETDTGNVKVPQSTSGGRCEITTDTGDVKLDIQ